MLAAVVLLTAPVGAVSAGARKRESPPWIPVRSAATTHQFGQLPTRAPQVVLGRLRLDHLTRVSSVVIRGRKTTGDLLVIHGEYQNLTSQATYWTEGYAFVFGTKPRRCTLDTCGPLPKGAWMLMTHGFGTPIVDYPATGKVAAHQTVTFREAIPLPPAKRPNPAIRSLRDIWLLPIYAAFNYYELPFPPSQLIRLSAYFGRTSIPRA
jgi:hypothetical protein